MLFIKLQLSSDSLCDAVVVYPWPLIHYYQTTGIIDVYADRGTWPTAMALSTEVFQRPGCEMACLCQVIGTQAVTGNGLKPGPDFLLG